MPSGVSGRTHREVGPIRGLRSTRAFRRDSTGFLGPFGERGRQGRFGDQGGRRSSGRHPSAFLREHARETLPYPTGQNALRPLGGGGRTASFGKPRGCGGTFGPFRSEPTPSGGGKGAFSCGGRPAGHPGAFGQRERHRTGLGRTGTVRDVSGRPSQACVPGRASGLSRNAPRLLLGAARGGSGPRTAAEPEMHCPRTMRRRQHMVADRTLGRGPRRKRFGALAVGVIRPRTVIIKGRIPASGTQSADPGPQ